MLKRSKDFSLAFKPFKERLADRAVDAHHFERKLTWQTCVRDNVHVCHTARAQRLVNAICLVDDLARLKQRTLTPV